MSNKYIDYFFCNNFLIFVLLMTFDDGQFSVVVDKGTIDALISNKSEQVGFK